MVDEMQVLKTFRSDVESPDPATLSRISGAVATRVGVGVGGSGQRPLEGPGDGSLIYVPDLLGDPSPLSNSTKVAPRHRVLMAVAAVLVILAGAVALNVGGEGSEGSLATETDVSPPEVDPDPTLLPETTEAAEPDRSKDRSDLLPPETSFDIEPEPGGSSPNPALPLPTSPVPTVPENAPGAAPQTPTPTEPDAGPTPAGWEAYCEVWNAPENHGLAPQDYVGSAVHIEKLRRLAETAPSSINAEAWIWHDFVAGGGLEPVDIDTNTTHLWPPEVQEAQRVLMAATLNCPIS